MKTNYSRNGFRKISGILLFSCISALLWVMIKLSDNYVVTVPFDIRLTEQPANQTISNNKYSIEATIEASGYKLLNYCLLPKKYREVKISLRETKYKKIDDNRYSIGSAYVKEQIANFFEINVNEVNINENDLAFSMYKLASKRVKVIPKTNITFESQFNMYGEPSVTPDSITINGAYNTIKDIYFVNTNTVVAKNVRENVSQTVGLQLDDDVYSDTEEVEVMIDVEKFTESEVTIPIHTLNMSNLYLYPDFVRIRYIVAMKDYSNISNMSFKVEIDTNNFMSKERLPLRLVISPSNTKVIGISPAEVDYVLTK